MEIQLVKKALRASQKRVLAALTSARRQEAAQALLSWAEQNFQKGTLLSFASFGYEIETSALNAYLSARVQLALPRIEREGIRFYRISHLLLQTELTHFGLREPIPEKCDPIDPAEIDTMLVPGLAFDASGYRLGYGKGHYDRFLKSITAATIGIGFHEQLLGQIPVEEHDIPLSAICSF
jgi:5-formyltetrahydrofolate cyclo-ligase